MKVRRGFGKVRYPCIDPNPRKGRKDRSGSAGTDAAGGQPLGRGILDRGTEPIMKASGKGIWMDLFQGGITACGRKTYCGEWTVKHAASRPLVR